MATQLFEYGWRLGILCNLKSLLSQVESRHRIGVNELRYQFGWACCRKLGSRIPTAQIHPYTCGVEVSMLGACCCCSRTRSVRGMPTRLEPQLMSTASTASLYRILIWKDITE